MNHLFLQQNPSTKRKKTCCDTFWCAKTGGGCAGQPPPPPSPLKPPPPPLKRSPAPPPPPRCPMVGVCGDVGAKGLCVPTEAPPPPPSPAGSPVANAVWQRYLRRCEGNQVRMTWHGRPQCNMRGGQEASHAPSLPPPHHLSCSEWDPGLTDACEPAAQEERTRRFATMKQPTLSARTGRDEGCPRGTRRATGAGGPRHSGAHKVRRPVAVRWRGRAGGSRRPQAE